MSSQSQFEIDHIPTSQGDLEITFLGHGSLYLAYADKNIYVDPYSKVADYSRLPKADLVLSTHEHFDHLDPQALGCIRTDQTTLILNPAGAQQVGSGIAMRNGDELDVQGIHIKAVPAYNLVHKRDNGQPFHPQGIGNGYLMTFGDVKVYVAGDTENTSEMKALQGIDIAFLPMNTPYTMTPEMVADAVRAFKPKVIYPYHFGSTDTSKLVDLLKDEKGIEVRIRKMS